MIVFKLTGYQPFRYTVSGRISGIRIRYPAGYREFESGIWPDIEYKKRPDYHTGYRTEYDRIAGQFLDMPKFFHKISNKFICQGYRDPYFLDDNKMIFVKFGKSNFSSHLVSWFILNFTRHLNVE
jgi:hypothetical protein